MKHLYVHVPFCGRRCTYCDFSIAVRKRVPVDEFVTGVEQELALRFADADAWTLDTLYMGGGTPSRLGQSGVARLIDVIRRHAEIGDNAEVTLEANPEDITVSAARAWREAGVTRLSIGAQSFNDDVLRWMHRTHDSDAIDRSVDAARSGGIDNYSLDLIFALPEILARDWEKDLARVLSLEPTHVSLYGLTVEPMTPLGRRRARGDLAEAPEESYVREFLEAHHALARAGFEHYEVSNFARSHRHSRHNSAYWASTPYGGIGPSAHEFDGAVRRWNLAAYGQWLERLSAKADPIADSERLSSENRVAEDVYLGLRTLRGLQISNTEVERTRAWLEEGWATLDGGGKLVLTPLGWLRLDSLAADLTLFRSHS
jgi:oxygen-independent coproporphyrinogen-3 oxidase